MNQTIGMMEAKSKLAELVGQVKYGGRRYILERRGQPMAMLISVEEYERMQVLSGADVATPASPLPPELQRRQAQLVARARALEQRIGDPVTGLAVLFSGLPPGDDSFWLEIQETG